MRVHISPQIFPDARPARIGELCGHGLEGRHRLQITNDTDPDFKEWMDSLKESERLDWIDALKRGNRDDKVEVSAYEIEIVNGNHSTWDHPCPKLTLADALDLLREKFKIVLEGDAEDCDFVRCMSTPEQFQTLEDFETIRKCFRFSFAGGLGSMIKRARRDAETPGARYRRWYVFDSDGLRPNEESGGRKS